MARRERRDRDNNRIRIDLSELDIHSVLLEDLRHYVGSPKSYIPKIWDVCVSVLREEQRIILTERDNKDVLDRVWNDFYDEFSEAKFKNIVRTEHLSVRMDGYRDNVTHFLYDVFVLIYPQVAAIVDIKTRGKSDVGFLTYGIRVDEVVYDAIYDGFDTINKEVAVKGEITTSNYLTKYLLSDKGYDF